MKAEIKAELAPSVKSEPAQPLEPAPIVKIEPAQPLEPAPIVEIEPAQPLEGDEVAADAGEQAEHPLKRVYEAISQEGLVNILLDKETALTNLKAVLDASRRQCMMSTRNYTRTKTKWDKVRRTVRKTKVKVEVDRYHRGRKNKVTSPWGGVTLIVFW